MLFLRGVASLIKGESCGIRFVLIKCTKSSPLPVLLPKGKFRTHDQEAASVILLALIVRTSLVPRTLSAFISWPWRKSGSGLGNKAM